jgi:hypothetical protein
LGSRLPVFADAQRPSLFPAVADRADPPGDRDDLRAVEAILNAVASAAVVTARQMP